MAIESLSNANTTREDALFQLQEGLLKLDHQLIDLRHAIDKAYEGASLAVVQERLSEAHAALTAAMDGFVPGVEEVAHD